MEKLELESINQYLIKKGVVYDDIRLELLDHMACEVAAEKKKGLSFEEASQKTYSKWTADLTLKSSFWLSSVDFYPVIVLKKIEKIYVKHFLLFVVLFAPVLFLENKIELALKPYAEFATVFTLVSISIVVFQIIIGAKLLFTKGQTTFKKLIWFFLKTNIIINFIVLYSNNKMLFGVLILITNLITSGFIYNWYVKNKSFISITN